MWLQRVAATGVKENTLNNHHLGGLPQGLTASVGLMLVFGGTGSLVWHAGKGDPVPLLLAAIASGMLATFSVWQMGERVKQQVRASVSQGRR